MYFKGDFSSEKREDFTQRNGEENELIFEVKNYPIFEALFEVKMGVKKHPFFRGEKSVGFSPPKVVFRGG